jgi:alkylated DNA repair dioxygenase AlkB
MDTLFDSDSSPRSRERLEEGAVLLRGFATSEAPVLLEEVARIARAATFRHLTTPGGYTMSVAMTNCGRVGWVSDHTGYRYDRARLVRSCRCGATRGGESALRSARPAVDGGWAVRVCVGCVP